MKKISILMVCHGNICRSPMAEYIMRDMVEKAGLSERIYVESAAVSSEEIGNPVHRGTVRVLSAMGISCKEKRARRMTRADYAAFDYLIGMDEWNLSGMRRIAGGDPDGKIHGLLDFTGVAGEIADPWYTGDFEHTKRDVVRGCTALLAHLRQNEPDKS